MALKTLTTHWALDASATANNVNGGGFNTANAGMLTNFACDANTGNTASPVISSASYNFVAGDVGAWFYVQAGTSWTPGWYQIASVAANKATLSAGVGVAVQFINGRFQPNTVAGCGTVATPTSGTGSVDYSQGTTAIVNGISDFTAVGASTTLTSATAGFTPVMVGNIFHQTTTGTGAFGVVGWYEIATYVNATTVTLDRTENSGTTSVACTGYIGGAMSLNSTLDADLYAAMPASTWVWKKKGTYTAGEAIGTATAGSAANPSMLIGFTSIRGDVCNTTDRPTLAMGSLAWSAGVTWNYHNLIVTGTAATLVAAVNTSLFYNCKIVNSSTTVNRLALSIGTGQMVTNSEVICYMGRAVTMGNASGQVVQYCYIHDSDQGIRQTGGTPTCVITNNIIASCVTAAINIGSASTGGSFNITGNTFYGAENKLGTGLLLVTTSIGSFRCYNNIFYGFVTAVNDPDSGGTFAIADYNDYFNNTTDIANWYKGPNDIAVNPSFTNVTQLTGSGAGVSSATNVLTDTGANFGSVVDNQDFVYISAITGTGSAVGKYLITAHTTTTLTLSSNLTSSGAGSAITYEVTLGHNFLPTGNI